MKVNVDVFDSIAEALTQILEFYRGSKFTDLKMKVCKSKQLIYRPYTGLV